MGPKASLVKVRQEKGFTKDDLLYLAKVVGGYSSGMIVLQNIFPKFFSLMPSTIRDLFMKMSQNPLNMGLRRKLTCNDSEVLPASVPD